MILQELQQLRQELLTELPRILQYWIKNGIESNGKFLTLGCNNRPLENGQRSAVLMARDLWAFSAAYRLTGQEEYLATSQQAFADFESEYLDHINGGVYEKLDKESRPMNKNKLIYTQSYAIYGCSEFYLAAGEEKALAIARKLYEKIEAYAYYPIQNGYCPICAEDWKSFTSWGDYPELKERFLLDTFLHLTEAYTNLYKAWPDEALKFRLKNLVEILLNHFLRPNGALYQELDTNWKPTEDLSDRYGDEAECCWMICEASDQIKDTWLTVRMQEAVCRMMDNLVQNGYDKKYGGVFDRLNTDGSMCTDKMWWEESESVIGLLYAYRISRNQVYLNKALGTWNFIAKYIINPEEEWNWKTHADGSFVEITNPADPLKCPYHNTRVVTHAIAVIDTLM